MNIKDLLQQAQSQKAAHDREEELRLLDLSAEEYMLLREDAQHIGVEILQSISEKIGRAEWIVDEKTHRLCRTSSARGRAVQGRLSYGVQNTQFSLAITSNSKRFFVKLYRDYEEFDEAILANATSLISCVDLIEEELNARLLRLEMHKQNLLNAYRNECVSLIAQVNEAFASAVDIANQKILLASEAHQEAIHFCKEYCKDLDQTRVTLAVGYQSLFDENCIIESEGAHYAEIDGVVCKLEGYNGSSADLTICLRDIYKCIPTPDLTLLKPLSFKLVSLKEDYLVVESVLSRDDIEWYGLDIGYSYGVLAELSDLLKDTQSFPNGARLMAEGAKIKPYLEGVLDKIPKSIDALLAFRLSPLQSDSAGVKPLTADLKKIFEFKLPASGRVDIRSEDYKTHLQKWLTEQREKISALIWHLSNK